MSNASFSGSGRINSLFGHKFKASIPTVLFERGIITSTDAAGYPVTEAEAYTYTIYHGGAWYGMACLAFVLLALCFLLAGLTLGVCGLDMAWLQMRTITGTAKQRQQALIVARMKCHASWMLCSLILCSVACSEYFPFVIQSLCAVNKEWLPVLLSTLLLAIFAEIIPQWLIPQRAVAWGYYCWPLIWGCMWLTAIVSFPLAWILDNVWRTRKDEFGVFSNEELAIIIKYHERSEKRGGMLGQDTTRIILGALNNDTRRISGDVSRMPESSYEGSEKDVEKANLVVTQGMIVKWSAVKTVDIEEAVDTVFIQKVKGWSYSRIPVIGQSKSKNSVNATAKSDWEGKKVYGFLHIKNLVGLDIKAKQGSTEVLVKDLPLYPLPIVRDEMPVNELLNMFQLGMSRMAIVVPTALPSKPLVGTSSTEAPLWTATKRTNAQIMSRMRGVKENVNWTTDYLAAAQANIESPLHGRRRVQGINSPKPIGIITFEDIIDTLLQKTSRDEKDFFDRKTNSPPTKTKKAGDYQPAVRVHNSARNNTGSLLDRNQPSNYGTLRKRKVSRMDRVAGADGADEHSLEGSDALKHAKVRNEYGDSSYTQNSLGGFHVTSESTSFDSAMVMTSPDIAELGKSSSSDCPGNASLPVKTVSLPSRKGKNGLLLQGVGPIGMWRHFSAPKLRQLRRVTPISKQNYSSYEKMGEGADEEQLGMLTSSIKQKTLSQVSGFNVDVGMDDTFDYVREHARENSGDTVSLIGCTTQIFDADPVSTISYKTVANARVFDQHQGGSKEPREEVLTDSAIEARKPAEVTVANRYDGFPPELLDLNKESHVPNYASKTMPRTMCPFSENALRERNGSETPSRERGFHDDRALLPSQGRTLDESATMGNRRSLSLWF